MAQELSFLTFYFGCQVIYSCAQSMDAMKTELLENKCFQQHIHLNAYLIHAGSTKKWADWWRNAEVDWDWDRGKPGVRWLSGIW